MTPFGRVLKSLLFSSVGRLTSDKLKRYAPLARGRVLDIGTGTRPYERFFGNAAEYVGTNARRFYSPEEIDHVRRFTDFWVEDALALPFGPGEFDAVLCFQVLSVVSDPGAFFAEVRRVLKPGGIFILGTDFLYPKWSDEDCLRHTDFSLRTLSTANGFDVVAIESCGGFFTMQYNGFVSFLKWSLRLDRISEGNPIEILKTLLLLAVYCLWPIIDLAGAIIYLLEKRTVDAHRFAMNNLLVARRAD